MKEPMSWSTCLAGHISKVTPDEEKIKSMIKMCNVRLKTISQITVDDETASIVACDYYEIIKELLVGLLLKSGLKSDNHECLIAFFRHKFPEYEYESNLIYGLKDVRNRASYDGIFVKKDYIDKNHLEFNHIIKLLNKLLED